MFVHSLLKKNYFSCVQNRVRPTNKHQNENTTSNKRVPKSNMMVRAFAECLQNKSLLQKFGSPVFASRSIENSSTLRSTYM